MCARFFFKRIDTCLRSQYRIDSAELKKKLTHTHTMEENRATIKQSALKKKKKKLIKCVEQNNNFKTRTKLKKKQGKRVTCEHILRTHTFIHKINVEYVWILINIEFNWLFNHRKTYVFNYVCVYSVKMCTDRG